MICANPATFGRGKGKMSCAKDSSIGRRVRSQYESRTKGSACLASREGLRRWPLRLERQQFQELTAAREQRKGLGVGHADPIR